MHMHPLIFAIFSDRLQIGKIASLGNYYLQKNVNKPLLRLGHVHILSVTER